MGGFGEAAVLAVTIAAAAASAYAAYESGQQQSAAAKYNAKLQENEAIAAQNAAQVEAQRRREENLSEARRTRALIGASGTEEAGSSLLALLENVQAGERDAQLIAYGAELQASSHRGQAGYYKLRSRQAEREGMIGAGTSLLTSSARIGGAYYPLGGRRGTSPYGY